MCTPARC